MRSLCCVFSLIGLALLSGGYVHAAPLATRDQNPFLAGFGLPAPLPSDVEQLPAWDAQFNWASDAIAQNDGSEHLTVDAETKELRLVLAYQWDDRWAMRVQLPYREISGGSLDSFIDDWHDWFGLPEGIRPLQPHDRLLIEYSQSGVQRLHLTDEVRGFGDASIDAGYQAFATDQSKLMLWTSIKLPTGDAERLTGSGAVDASIAAALNHRFASRWEVAAQLAATRLGNGNLPGREQKDFVMSGFAALTFNVTPATELTAQIDAHTAAFDSNLHFLGEAQILTLGGAHRFRSGWRLELGVSEDIAVDASPDVVFVVRVKN
jgi:hypothetical protein